jgi:hypothetical protein
MMRRSAARKKNEGRELILAVVDEQLESGVPEETGLTFRRLVGSGYTEEEAKEKIAAALIHEVYDLLKENAPYNEERYVAGLRGLK